MSANCIRFVKRYLCVKKLTVNDGFTTKSVKLPRAEARFFMGELRNRQATPLVLLDEDGSCWELLCTCTGGQYALSRIGAFCEAHGARPGCYFIFYADHDHIVRLAVRQQLPEDVQAAVAAARAALVTRTSPPRAAQQQPQQHPPPLQQQPPALGSTLGPSQAPQPILDDPAALDEMPLSASMHEGGHQASAAPAPSPCPRPVITTEPPRAMPLQDRSNLPAGGVLSEAAGNGNKPKPTASKPDPLAPAARTAANEAFDKENNAAAAAKPVDKPHALVATSPKTSTGGLSMPVTAADSSSQQQNPAPRPPCPAPSSSAQGRSTPPQPAPPPATRLRLRFEARLRAQAGKLHPLSVRSGPETPPPAVPGDNGGSGVLDFCLGGPCPMQQAANPGCGFLPFNWGVASWNRRASAPGCYSHDGASMAAAHAGGSNAELHHGNSPYGHAMNGSLSPCSHQEGDSPSGTREGRAAQLDIDEEPQLQCDELLDWEGSRPATCRPGQAAHLGDAGPSHAAGLGLAAAAGPAVRAAPPGWAAREQAVTQSMNLMLLRHLLLRIQNQSIPGERDKAAGQLAQQAALDSALQSQTAGRLAASGPPEGGGGQLSMAAADSTLRQLLGASPVAAGGNLAAASRGPGFASQPASAAQAAEALRTRRSGGGATPSGAAPGTAGGTSTTGVDAQRPTRAVADAASTSQPSLVLGDGLGVGQVFEARAKSSLSVSRSAPGPPLDSPSSKRMCSVWELFPAFAPQLRSSNGPPAATPAPDPGPPAPTMAPPPQAPQPAPRPPNPAAGAPGADQTNRKGTPVSQLFNSAAAPWSTDVPTPPATAPPPPQPRQAAQQPPSAASGSSQVHRGSKKTIPVWELFPPLATLPWGAKRPPPFAPVPGSASAATASAAAPPPHPQLAHPPPRPAATPPGVELVSKALTAHDLLMDRVLLSVAAATWSQATGLPLQDGEPGRLAACSAARGQGGAGDGGGVEPMDVDVCTHSAEHGGRASTPSPATAHGLTAHGAAVGEPQQQQQQQGADKGTIAVSVVVESGATYDAALLAGGSGGPAGAPGDKLEYELQGLRPYLIRRQAGVGDVLSLWIAPPGDRGCAPSVLCLHAQLQQRAMAV